MRQPLGRMVAALDAAVAVARHEAESLDVGTLDGLDDDVCRLCGEGAESAFLPRREQWAHRPVIGDGGARGEREPTPRAFEAAVDRPGGGRAAARTRRAAQTWEQSEAAGAERFSEPTTSGAAARNQQVEQHIRPKLRGQDARVSDETAPKVCR